MTKAFNRSFAPKRFRPAARSAPSAFLPSPVPSAVVDAVLRYHDEALEQGLGRTLLRLSPRRLHDREVVAALGQLTARAAHVAILWNEREGEIIRVLEETPRLAA